MDHGSYLLAIKVAVSLTEFVMFVCVIDKFIHHEGRLNNNMQKWKKEKEKEKNNNR